MNATGPPGADAHAPRPVPPADPSADRQPPGDPPGSRSGKGSGALLVAAVALPLALTALSTWTTWRDTWHDAQGELRRDAQAAAEYAGRVLDAHRLAAARIGDHLPWLQDAAIGGRAEASLARLLEPVPSVLAALVIDAEGRVRLRLGQAAGSDATAAAAGEAARPEGLRLGPAGVPGRLVLTVPRIGADAAMAGPAAAAVRLVIDAQAVAAGLSALRSTQHDTISLVGLEGAVLARAAPPGPPPATDRIGPDSPLLAPILRGEERAGTHAPSSLDGVARLAELRRVAGWPAYVVVARPDSSVVRAWREAVVPPALLGLASSLLLAALALGVRQRQRALERANAELGRRVVERTSDAARAFAAAEAGDQRLRLAIEAAGFGGWEMELPSRRIARSGVVVPARPDLPLSGYDLARHLEDVVHPEDRARVRAVVDAVAAGRTDRYRMEYRVRRLEGGWLWMESYGRVVARDAASGLPSRLAGVSRDVSEHKAAEAALRTSEARLRLAVEAARFSTWEYDLRGDVGQRNGALAKALPVVPETGFRFADWMAAIHPEDRPAVEAAFRSVMRGERDSTMVEFRVRRPDGRWASIESAGAAVERDPATGEVLRMAGVAHDVTERHAAAQRQTLLAREVDHRAKNALAVVLAALRLTPRQDAAAYAAAVEGRVRALARAHTLLAEANWAGASLRTLAEAELAAFQHDRAGLEGGPRATMEGPDLTLAPAAAQGLSMVLHELATNATKYGAFSAAAGRVALAWQLDEAAGRLQLRWEERGGPAPAAAPPRRGFGSRVIEATVCDQLGGTLQRDWGAEGLACRIAIPLGRVVAAPAAEDGETRPARGGAGAREATQRAAE